MTDCVNINLPESTWIPKDDNTSRTRKSGSMARRGNLSHGVKTPVAALLALNGRFVSNRLGPGGYSLRISLGIGLLAAIATSCGFADDVTFDQTVKFTGGSMVEMVH